MHFIILTIGAAELNRLSETELLTQYPAVALATMLLLGAGLLCDFYLLLLLTRRAVSSTTAPLLRVGPKPWSLRDLWFATGVLILVLATGNALLDLALKLAHVDEADAMPWMLGINMLLYALCLMGFLVFFRQRQIAWKEAVGLDRKSVFGAAAFGGFFFFAVLPPLAGTFVLYDRLCQVVGIKETPQPIAELLASSDSTMVIVLVSIFAVVVAPVFEEFFFRGFAYPALKQRWGTWKALAIVSAVFAAVHQHIPSLGPLFTLAVGLALAYELTGSLIASITIHSLFNVMNVGMLLYVRAHS
ncbi:MAG TPA: CPBP family intramembrane glutamic endopeptidase [Verrucomicrobiae bacterium]|nr:CPBP family intramembrane glutamic endopeptidase [Verrucomicrobiae bacterium]